MKLQAKASPVVLAGWKGAKEFQVFGLWVVEITLAMGYISHQYEAQPFITREATNEC